MKKLVLSALLFTSAAVLAQDSTGVAKDHKNHKKDNHKDHKEGKKDHKDHKDKEGKKENHKENKSNCPRSFYWLYDQHDKIKKNFKRL